MYLKARRSIVKLNRKITVCAGTIISGSVRERKRLDHWIGGGLRFRNEKRRSSA